MAKVYVGKKIKKVLIKPKKRKASMEQKITKLNKEVNKMKKSIEVKRSQELNVSSNVVGQVNVNNTGALCIAATMNTSDGSANTNRIGDRVKLIGYSIRCQIAQQTLAASNGKFLIEVWKTQDIVTTPVSAHLNYLFQSDTISGVVDINSTRVSWYDKHYQRVFKKYYTVSSDTVSNGNMIRDIKIFIKQNQILTYSTTAADEPANIKYLITVRCSTGNCNTSTNSTLPNLANTGATTGYYFRCVSNMYYVDL